MQAWVEEYYHQGMPIGCSTNPFRYCPEDPTNRASMVVFIDRAYSFLQLP